MAITNYFGNMTTIRDLLAVANSQSGGWFWLAMLLVLFVVQVVVFIPYGIVSSVVASAFISLVVGIFLTYLNLMAWEWLMFFLGLILFMLFYSIWNKRE